MITIRDHKKNTLNIALADENKASKVKIRLEKINAPDKTHFLKQDSEVIYANMLHATLANSYYAIKKI